MAAFGVVWRSIQRDCLYRPRWSRQEQVRGKARQLRRCLQETGEQLARSSQLPNPDSKDTLAEVRIPVVWSDGGGIKRVLRPELKLHRTDSYSGLCITSKELMEWIEEDDKGYFVRTLRGLHKKRFIEFTESTDKVKILPPCAKFVQDLIRKKKLTGI